MKKLIYSLALGLTSLVANAADTVKVGVLHSLSGTMAIVIAQGKHNYGFDYELPGN